MAVALQGGWLGGLLGITEPTPIPTWAPMMMFALLFGLSMDYEVFLLSRIREEYQRTGDNASAVASGHRPDRPGHLRRGGDHGDGVRRLHPQRPGAGEGDRPRARLGRAARRDRRPAWCSCRRPWSCSATATGGCPRWLDRLLPRLDVEGHSTADLDTELAELTERRARRDALTWVVPARTRRVCRHRRQSPSVLAMMVFITSLVPP